MRTINIYLRVTEHTTTEVTAQNRPKSQRSYIIRNQPVTLRIGIFRHEAAVAIMSKAELEAEGWKTWLLNISKNHTLSYPVYIQPDYDYENPPITVSEEGVISVVLNKTDTEESAKAIKGMPGDMWEAELTGFAEDDTTLEAPLAILQWPIGYINRVANENADAPGLLESTYYTKEQVNELLRQIAPEGTWGHIIGNITDQEDLIALLEEKANKATTLAGYGITDAYTKTEIDSKVASVYRYKGSVNAYADLPTKDQQVGDVYNVVNADEEHGIKAGDNVAWNGEKWDVLAGEIDLSGYIQKDEKGEPNGVPTLDENGKVPMSQMPVLHLDALPTTSTSGSVGQLAVYHDATTGKGHLYHLCFVSEGESATLYHWEECVLQSERNVAGGFAGLGEDGYIIASKLPLMTTRTRGAAGLWPQGGVLITSGNLYLYSAGNAHIDARVAGADNSMTINARSPIVPACLDYAVRSVLPNVTEIPAATSDYSLVDSSATTNNHSHVYSHSPSAVPTYRLPQVTNTTIAHYIELTVDFTNVQTYSFLDYQGEPIVPLFTPAIAAGDVYTFKMEYSAIKAAWLIYPQKQGAVADDFVMRGEVGAANGVAGLDASAKIISNQIPLASSSSIGGGKIIQSRGLFLGGSNSDTITISQAAESSITNRNSSYNPITPERLNHAVTAALTDSRHITLNDAQKATAQSVFGVGGDLTGTGAPTTSTVGKVMDRYLDTATGKTYTCTAVTVDDTDPNNVVTTYTWTDDVNEKGGTFNGNIKLGFYNHLSLGNSSVNGYGAIAGGYGTTAQSFSIAAGMQTYASYRGMACGYRSLVDDTNTLYFVVGTGIESPNRYKNGLEFSSTGMLYCEGAYQQGAKEIPSDTTEYALTEGVFLHIPTNASLYTLPPVCLGLITNNKYYDRYEAGDGVNTSNIAYYAWQQRGGTNKRYTASPTPVQGDASYSNVNLVSGPIAITYLDIRTHECILTIKFSASVLTYEFQDSAGTTLVPLPLNGDIEAGSVVTFLCRYNSLLSQWVIYPVMDGKEAE